MASSPDDTLLSLLSDDNAWVRSCACLVAREQGLERAGDALVSNANAPWPVLREAALASLERLAPRADLPAVLKRAQKDESELVRRRVASWPVRSSVA